MLWLQRCPACAVAAQDAIIKAYRPADTAFRDGKSTAEPANGSAPAMQNGAGTMQPPPPLALPEEATPDARSLPGEGHCASVCALALCGGLLCSAGGDASIRIWHPATLRLQRWGACCCVMTAAHAPCGTFRMHGWHGLYA